jgi:hypothetical protein
MVTPAGRAAGAAGSPWLTSARGAGGRADPGGGDAGAQPAAARPRAVPQPDALQGRPARFRPLFALFSPSFRPFSLFSLALIWALGRGARPARSRPLPARRASPSRARVRPRDPREGDSHEAGFGALVYPRARAARQVSLSEFLFTTMHDLWRVEAPIAELS